MEGYSVRISEIYGVESDTLTARQRLMLKDFSNAVSLDEATQAGNFRFSPAFFATLDVNNEKAEDKHYQKYVVVTTDSTKLVTGSKSFITSLREIMAEMTGSGEEYQVECFRKPSANYKGKEFLTCSII